MDSITGHIITCKCCGNLFVICKQCYRGHKYCSGECKETGYELNRKLARQKYNKTIEAKLDHRDRNRKYRMREKTVMDKSSTEFHLVVNKHSHESNHQALMDLQKRAGICIACKKIVFKQGVLIYGGSV